MVTRQSLSGRKSASLVPPVPVTEDPPVDESDERPWERKGQVRRDAEPHRGLALDVLGMSSVLSGIISFFLLIPT